MRCRCKGLGWDGTVRTRADRERVGHRLPHRIIHTYIHTESCVAQQCAYTSLFKAFDSSLLVPVLVLPAGAIKCKSVSIFQRYAMWDGVLQSSQELLAVAASTTVLDRYDYKTSLKLSVYCCG